MVSRICWHCGINSHMSLPDTAYGPVSYQNGADLWRFAFPSADTPAAASAGFFVIYVCDECGYPNLAGYRGKGGPEGVAVEVVYDFEHPDSWIPERIEEPEFEGVPEQVASAAGEAFRCYSIHAYRAAVVMARGVLEAIVDKTITTPLKENGHEMTLNEKLGSLVRDGKISKILGESAGAIKDIGNGSTHNAFEPVEAEEAEMILQFLELVLEEVYQRSTRFKKLDDTRRRFEAAKAKRISSSHSDGAS